MFSSKGLSSVAVYLVLLPLLLLTAFSSVAGDETEVQLSPTDNSWAVNQTTNVSTFAKESQRLFDTVDASAELSSSPPSAAAPATEALNNSTAASDATDVAFNVSASQSTTTDAANWIQLQQPTSFSPDGANNVTSESVDDSRSNSTESDTNNKLVAMMEDELLPPSSSSSMTAAAETLDTTAAAAAPDANLTRGQEALDITAMSANSSVSRLVSTAIEDDGNSDGNKTASASFLEEIDRWLTAENDAVENGSNLTTIQRLAELLAPFNDSLDSNKTDTQIDGQETSDDEAVDVTTTAVMSEVHNNSNDTLLWQTTTMFDDAEKTTKMAPSTEWNSTAASTAAAAATEGISMASPSEQVKVDNVTTVKVADITSATLTNTTDVISAVQSPSTSTPSPTEAVAVTAAETTENSARNGEVISDPTVTSDSEHYVKPMPSTMAMTMWLATAVCIGLTGLVIILGLYGRRCYQQWKTWGYRSIEKDLGF